MHNTTKSRSLTLFYILVAYVFLQLIWWATHIIQLTSQLGEDDEYTSRRIAMIVGEGFVFFILLSFGVYKIRKAFKQEVKLVQQKQNFALSVSHELKSPIATIKLFLQTLEKRELSEEKKLDILNKCISSANRLDSLVNNILLSNVVDSKTYQLTYENFNLKQTLVDMISISKETNKEADIKLNYSGNEGVNLDKNLLTSIFTNLLQNALKYSEKPEKITVNTLVNSNSLKISIADEGRGISKEDLPYIFNRFYRSENEITRTVKGTGLGLYIVKEMTELLSGEIKITENQPKGSVFTLTLPLKRNTND